MKKKKKLIREKKVEYKPWRHPGGKLMQFGPEKMTDTELLAILISTGVKGKSAERIAEEIMERFGSFKGLANQPFEKLQTFKGLGQVKTIRIAAAFEIARRIVHQIKHEQ
jgi:DNA repair protein RadC